MAEANEAGQITKAYGFNPNTHDAEEELWSTDPVWQADIHNGSLTSSQTRYHYITTDHLGTPILATDKSGNKTWRGYSQAFGHTDLEADNSTQINLRFPGQYFDRETGLHQNYFRDYSPARGRYVQSDPIGIYSDVNIYAYSFNGPIIYFDPYGLFGWRDAAGFIPVIGSGLDAYEAYRCGLYGRALFNFGLAIFDATGIGATVKGLTVGTMRFANRKTINEIYRSSSNWNQMRRRLQKAGEIPRNSRSTPKAEQLTTDHIFVKQREGRPHLITNHPRNLQINVTQSLNSKFEHMGAFERSLYLPAWMKFFGAGLASYATGVFVENGCESCQ